MVKKWSKQFDFCVVCKTTDRKHKGHGMCKNCYINSKYVPRNNIEKLNCIFCSKEFIKHPPAKKHLFCSKVCYLKFKKQERARKEKLPLPYILRMCIECGFCYVTTLKRKKYCSKRCTSRFGGKVYRDRRRRNILKNKKSLAWRKAVKVDEKTIFESELSRFKRTNSRRKKDISFELSLDEFILLVKDNCIYCGAGPSIKTHVGSGVHRNSIDRLDPKKEYSLSNCVTACWDCNKLKGLFNLEEFIDKVTRVSKFIKTYEFPNKKCIELLDRVQHYNNAFPSYPKLTFDSGWVVGSWSIGACYKGSGYHGAYPHKYLARIRSIFYEFTKDDTLHLFSGSLSPGFSTKDWSQDFPGITFDINPKLNPDVNGNAEELSTFFAAEKFSVVLADCPYTEEDAKRYGYPLISRNKVVKECFKVLKPGGFLVWLDMVLPMYSKKEFTRIGDIGISVSTNHRVRSVFIFQKAAP